MRTIPDLDDPVGGYFWRNAAEGRLTAQRCDSCHRFQHPPAVRCGHCGEDRFSVAELPHDGTVLSYVIPRRPVGATGSGVIIAVVEVDDDVRLVTNLVETAEADVRIGMPVTVQFTDVDGVTLPMFRPIA